MSRKLASVQYVHDIWPIEGADKIECVGVLGWKCVAKKGEFKVGDQCVYFEIDSFLPVRPEFEFLRSSSYKNSELLGEGFRLKTQKFRGQISQGLCLPTGILGEGEWILGSDVSAILGVRKWEIEERASSNGTIVAGLPDGVSKTEEARVQSAPEAIDEMSGLPYYITTKLDGTSVTMFRIDGRFGVCGHNFEYADDGKCSFWAWAHENGLEQRLIDASIDDVAIQGEFCGAGIQRNPLKLQRPDWFVFTVRDIADGRRYGLKEIREFCEKIGLKMVPVEEEGDAFSYADVDELLERARGKYEGGSVKEGIVVRPTEAVYSKSLSASLSFKVINNDYLLKKQKKE